MNPSEVFMALLLLPLFWLVVYGGLLVSQVRVGEAVPVFAIKCLLGLLMVGYGALLFYDVIPLTLPSWVNIRGFYDFPIEFLYQPSYGVVTLSMLMLLAVITKYAESYLHKEPGFHRFFVLIAVFLTAFPVVLFANNIDVLFVGWELIGVTSFLLIGFYELREQSIRNSWWALISYRLCDVGLLAASTLAHHAVHSTNLQVLNSPLASLSFHHPAHADVIWVIALCLVIASLAKAAQLPFTSWITRAMEGPTPSSALYYGALSIGLGPMLLLKFQGLILAFPWVQGFVILIGLLTASYTYIVAKTRSDAKTILALSAVFEVSVMVVEVGVGLHDWVIFHFVAHSFLRVFQFLRSMNAIQDFYDNPLFFRGAPHRSASWPWRWLPKSWRERSYYLAMNGFGLDWFVLNGCIRPWMAIWYRINRWENKLAIGEGGSHERV